MIKFRTEIDSSDISLDLNYQSKILFMGSCFTNNIGNQFRENCFDALVNPFGTIYNPLSIASNIELLINKEEQKECDLLFDKELYHNFKFHGSFSHTQVDHALSCMNKSITEGHTFLKEASHLFITFGTSYVFKTLADGKIVSNCHKLPNSHFQRAKADLSYMIDVWRDLLTKLSSFNPSLQVVLTVSPIRHISDGLHQNQVSKAQLILLGDYLCENFANATYFPSYEILLDDLRDYRFYENDLVHPNTLSISYIWEMIVNNCFNQDTLILLNKVQKIKKTIIHKPFNNQSDTYKQFLDNSLRELNLLSQKHPYLRMDEMRVLLQNKLQNSQGHHSF